MAPRERSMMLVTALVPNIAYARHLEISLKESKHPLRGGYRERADD